MKLLVSLLFATLSSICAAGPIAGVEGPFVSVAAGKLVLTLKLQEAVHPSGLTFHLSEQKKSRVRYTQLEEGGMELQLELDLDDLQSVSTAEGALNALPDGRNIPGIPGGKVKNSLKVDHTSDFVSYHSPKSFGLAIPFNWNLGTTRDGHHWLTWKGKNIGMISVVNASGDKKAYGLIFLRYSALRGNAELMRRLNGSRKALD